MTEELSSSLEDYLETILELTRDNPVARIKEIAEARGVKPGSVSPAMKRLEEMGLIKYGRRRYIELTEEGEKAAWKVFSRHQLLTSFFHEVLKMPEALSNKDACTMEHLLSPAAMDRIVSFFEFLNECPEGVNLLSKFHRHLENGCNCDAPECQGKRGTRAESFRSLLDLRAGEQATIVQVSANPSIRRRLLDMGILPSVPVEMVRTAPGGDPVWIRVHHYQVSLRREEASGVMVS